MKRVFAFGIAISAAFLLVKASDAAPSQSQDIVGLADQWFGMTIEQFEQANQIDPKYAYMHKSVSPWGDDVTMLTVRSVPALKDAKPTSLTVMVYTFDESGHLVEMGGFLAQGRTFDSAADELTAEYGTPAMKKEFSELHVKLWVWVVDGIAVELLPTGVQIHRTTQRCIDAMKATTPNPKAFEGCGRS